MDPFTQAIEAGSGISISVFLIIYLIFLLFFILYGAFNVYHLIRFGILGRPLFILVSVFSGGMILLIGGSLILIGQYDWSVPIFSEAMIQFENSADANSLYPL